MAELVVMVGIQGSGKSTWVRSHLIDTHVRLSRDMLRTANRQDILLHAALAAQASVVLDNTHVTRASRVRPIALAKAAGFSVRVVYLPVDVATALARNAKRSGAACVPDVAIHGTLAKLDVPSADEGFDQLDIIDITDITDITGPAEVS